MNYDKHPIRHKFRLCYAITTLFFCLVVLTMAILGFVFFKEFQDSIDTLTCS